MLGILHGHLLLKILEPLINLLNKKVKNTIHCTQHYRRPTKHPLNWVRQEGVASGMKFTASIQRHRQVGSGRDGPACGGRRAPCTSAWTAQEARRQRGRRAGPPRARAVAAVARARRRPPRGTPGAARPPVPQTARRTRSLPARSTASDDETASRRRQPKPKPNRRKKGGKGWERGGKPTLKSSRSRVRGSAAAGSAAVGMTAGRGGRRSGGFPSLLLSEGKAGVGMECRRCPFRLLGGRDEKCRTKWKNLQPRYRDIKMVLFTRL